MTKETDGNVGDHENDMEHKVMRNEEMAETVGMIRGIWKGETTRMKRNMEMVKWKRRKQEQQISRIKKRGVTRKTSIIARERGNGKK